MKLTTRNRWLGLIWAALLVGLVGCTKEKAEAIRASAEQLRVEATDALGQIRELLRRSVAAPVEGNEARITRLVADLNGTTPFTSAELNFILGETNLNTRALAVIDQEFSRLEFRFRQFAAIFRSLPQGHLLAAKSVKKAEPLAIHLTLDLITFAKNLRRHPVQFGDERVWLLEHIQHTKSLADESARKVQLEYAARRILELRDHETRAKEAAVLQCLKAAEISRSVAEMIRSYDSLSLGEVLSLMRQALSFAADITEGNVDVAGLLERFDGIESTIRSDPHWAEMLALKVDP